MARPLKWKEPEQVQKIVDEYFHRCESEDKPLTMVGLANALDVDRATLYRYRNPRTIEKDDLSEFEQTTENTKAELCTIITRAAARIEQYTAEKLFDKDAYKGAQFLLATNYNYRQVQTLEVQAEKDINISIGE